MPTRHLDTRVKLKLIRKIAGLTCGELASKTGIDKQTLGKIERCEQRLSPSKALLIGLATGSHPDWLKGKIGKSECPLAWDGRPYTLEIFTRWYGSSRSLTDTRPAEHWLRDWQTTRLIYSLVQLIRSACRRGKYEMVNRQLALVIKRVSDLFKLSDCGRRETIPFLGDGNAAINQFGSNSGEVHPSRMIKAVDVSDTEPYRELSKAGPKQAMGKGVATAKISYHDPTEVIKMQATLSPLFLFRLGDLAGLENWNAISEEIAVARGALDLLEEKLKR
jgi:transcriptional regulator with XRE-family HTH domain